ncbi:hypothetical protein K437DRAFT_154654 [Tilletiaria anomala UBC 951]|uniref:Uncharacterized protein n=1 Tax=Tilletiaria anomala (strain ATCC 24038 / CBS 436.72 / UBC 951) TaxID=1037660 RepID=A0A066VS32_TILAU|nr:uncharacterized protein K437DRAFT_154654 [Tilletiaria anomala UBC 951]KDN43093.1 hypothetical protein K437DRAFT_154654 [Tilletiaria anomala UBC 951]
MAAAVAPSSGSAAAALQTPASSPTRGSNLTGAPGRSLSLSSVSHAAKSGSSIPTVAASASVSGRISSKFSARPRRTSALPTLSASNGAAAAAGEVAPNGSLSNSSSSNTIGRSAGSQIVQAGKLPVPIATPLMEEGNNCRQVNDGAWRSVASALQRAQSNASLQSAQAVFPSQDPVPASTTPTKSGPFASFRRLMRGSSRAKSNPTHPAAAGVRQVSKPSEFGVLEEDTNFSDAGSAPSSSIGSRKRTKSEGKAGMIASSFKARDPPKIPSSSWIVRAAGPESKALQNESEGSGEIGGDKAAALEHSYQTLDAAMERVQQGSSTFDGLPFSSSTGLLRPTNNDEQTRSPHSAAFGLPAQDRSLTLQALQASPKRAGSLGLRPLNALDSADEESLLTHDHRATLKRQPSSSSASSFLGMGLAIGAGPNGSTEVLGNYSSGRQPSRLPGFEAARFISSNVRPAQSDGAQASIPKMWQPVDTADIRSSHEARDDDMTPILPSTNLCGGVQGSVADTEPTASWRTAVSSIVSSPDTACAAAAVAPLASTFSAGERSSRSLELPPRSKVEEPPLLDVFSNLERHFPSTVSSDADSSASMRAGIERITRSPAIAAGPSMEPMMFSSFATGPHASGHDMGATPYGSISSTSQARKRNTFGGGNEYLPRAYEPPPSSSYSSNLRSTHNDELSVSEIESNLAIIEAALNDNSFEGSFDPTVLRRRLGSPEQSFKVSSGQSRVATLNTSSHTLSPERITLRPQSHYAIAHAIREVRRAISSQLSGRIDESAESDVGAVTDTEPPESAKAPVRRRDLRETTPARAARYRQESMREVEETYGRMVNLVTASAGIQGSPIPIQGEVNQWGCNTRAISVLSRGPLAPGEGHDLIASPPSNATQQNTASQPASPVAARRRNTAPSFDESAIDPDRFDRSQEDIAVHTEAVHSQGSHAALKRSSGGSASNRGTSSTSPSLAIKMQGTPQSSQDRAAAEMHQACHPTDQRSSHSQPRSSPEARRASFDRLQAMIHEARIPEESIPLTQTRAQESTGNAILSQNISSSRASFQRASPAPLTLTSVLRQSFDSAGGHSRFSAERGAQLSNRLSNTELSVRGFHPIVALDDLADVQTVGTSILGSPLSSHNLTILQRRHNLEKNSLLDALERAKGEADQYRQQNEQLRTDLHQEVARMLELERAYEMSCSREDEMQSKVEKLEDQLRAEHEARIDLLDKLERISALWPGNNDGAVGDDFARMLPSTGHSASGVTSGAPGPSTAPSSAGDTFQRDALKLAASREPAIEATEVICGIDDTGPVTHQFEPVSAPTTRVRVSRHISHSPILTTRISDDDILISSDTSDYDGDDGPDRSLQPRAGSRSEGKGKVEARDTLRSYPSELGLHINSQEMSWGNLVDEAPPDETTAPDDSIMLGRRPTRSENSSMGAKETSKPILSVEADAPSSASAISSGAVLPTAMPAPAVAPSATASPSAPSKHRSQLPQLAAPIPTASVVTRTVSSSSVTTGETRRVPGSLPSSSQGSIRSVSGGQRASLIGASGIPKPASIHSRMGSGGGGMRKVSSATAATADSSFTARSNSPIGGFVAERGGKGGHYDERRPEGYSAVEVPGGLREMLADDSTEEAHHS